MEAWEQIARRQAGMIARRQLNALGIGRHLVRNQLAAGRWAAATPTVIATFTGPRPWEAEVWRAALHVGGESLIGGVSALEWYGLRNWHREDITVLIDSELSPEPATGIRFFRTRRPLARMRNPSQSLPIARVEVAALLFAGYDRSARTAQGVLAAIVQQRLTSPDRLLAELALQIPLRRSKVMRRALLEIGGGAQSMAELDVLRLCRRFGVPAPRRQTPRRDATGRIRFTDCEWALPDGTILILEVDGGFHMETEHWEDDLARQRSLSARGRIIVRCTTRELRDDAARVFADLMRLGLSQLCA